MNRRLLHRLPVSLLYPYIIIYLLRFCGPCPTMHIGRVRLKFLMYGFYRERPFHLGESAKRGLLAHVLLGHSMDEAEQDC